MQRSGRLSKTIAESPFLFFISALSACHFFLGSIQKKWNNLYNCSL